MRPAPSTVLFLEILLIRAGIVISNDSLQVLAPVSQLRISRSLPPSRFFIRLYFSLYSQ